MLKVRLRLRPQQCLAWARRHCTLWESQVPHWRRVRKQSSPGIVRGCSSLESSDYPWALPLPWPHEKCSSLEPRCARDLGLYRSSSTLPLQPGLTPTPLPGECPWVSSPHPLHSDVTNSSLLSHCICVWESSGITDGFS